jgi:hypothetical protein
LMEGGFVASGLRGAVGVELDQQIEIGAPAEQASQSCALVRQRDIMTAG